MDYSYVFQLFLVTSNSVLGLHTTWFYHSHGKGITS